MKAGLDRFGAILLISVPLLLVLAAATTVLFAYRYGRDIMMSELTSEQLRDIESLFQTKLPDEAKIDGFHARTAKESYVHLRFSVPRDQVAGMMNSSPLASESLRPIRGAPLQHPPFPPWWTPTVADAETATEQVVDANGPAQVTIWIQRPESADAVIFLEWRKRN